jgi:hypothetical protein
MSEYILEVADGSWADHEYVCDEWHRIELNLNKAKMTKLIRCRDCKLETDWMMFPGHGVCGGYEPVVPDA